MNIEQLFSEREHELIKKAAEELMQKKSREDISKMISPSAKKSSSEAGGDVSWVSVYGLFISGTVYQL